MARRARKATLGVMVIVGVVIAATRLGRDGGGKDATLPPIPASDTWPPVPVKPRAGG